MSKTTDLRARTRVPWPQALVLILLALVLTACGSSKAGSGQATKAAGSAPAAAYLTIPPLPGPPAPASTPARDGYKLLKSSPEHGVVGTSFTVTGDALPASKPVEFVWVTVDGSYDMDVLPDTVKFTQRKFVERRVLIAPSSGAASVDREGHLSATFIAPADYGGIHDIYAVVDGQEVGKAGYLLVRDVTLSPSSGPVGTPISVNVRGLGWKPWESTMALLWDNRYTGFLAATTTRGSVIGQIRAAGPVGKHSVEIGAASAAVPYLNYEQSPVSLPGFPRYRFEFTVTADKGAPAASLDWPDENYLVANPSSKTTVTAAGSLAAGVSASLSPGRGPVRSTATLQVAGLPPEDGLEMAWVTTVGNRNNPSGWALKELPLGGATTNQDGSLTATIQIPDDLGGWHTLRLLKDGKEIAEAPYFVERSLVTVTPSRVKAGGDFTVEIKGIGWTELDNGAAVVYDNAYIGYACGFNSQGDITLHMVASPTPGTHLIDIYPMIYQGQGKPPWSYELPILAFGQDAPGLSLGYRLPAFRLAIEVLR